jgi:Protein of unknown function (DUF2815)
MAVIKSAVGTLSFPNFFVARERVKGSSEKVFQGVLLYTAENIKHEAYKDMVKAAEELSRKSWPKLLLGKGVRSPFRRCDEKEDNSFPPEYIIFINAWSKQKPGVVDVNRQEILDSADVWAGQLARFALTPFAYDTQGNKGISFGLENVQIVKSAGQKRLDGRKSAQDRFDDHEIEAYVDEV